MPNIKNLLIIIPVIALFGVWNVYGHTLAAPLTGLASTNLHILSTSLAGTESDPTETTKEIVVTKDSNLKGENIKKGVSIFGGDGTLVPGPVPKTGQTKKYQDHDDAHLQKGLKWPTPRFTVNKNNQDEDVGTVTDNLTGLIWLKNANCAKDPMSWTNALKEVENLNKTGKMQNNDCKDTSKLLEDSSITQRHQNDWRLPNVKELRSLIHYGFHDPALSNTAGTAKWTEGEPFTGTLSSLYWSSSSHSNSTSNRWLVDLKFGGVHSDVETFVGYVWPVRGGQ